MIRLAVLLLFVAALAAIAAWVADHPGSVDIVWAGWHVQTSVALLLATSWAAVLAPLGIYWLLLRLVERTRLFGKARRERQRQSGLSALRQGFAALAADHPAEAAEAAANARKYLRDEPLAAWLSAQAAESTGDGDAAGEYYRDLTGDGDTAFLGWDGLMAQAEDAGRWREARSLAHKALLDQPDSRRALEKLIMFDARLGDWSSAAELLADPSNRRLLHEDLAKRLGAAVKTEQAAQLERRGDAAAAIRAAGEALFQLSGFAPAAAVAARAHLENGDAAKAERLIEDVWAQSPHPALAAIYAETQPGETPARRLARFEHLAGFKPDHAESKLALGEQAILAGNWEAARAVLTPLLQTAPGPRLFRLMAALEEGQRQSLKGARDWLSKAALAPAEAHFHCSECNRPARQWAAFCPHCGAFASMGWPGYVPARRPRLLPAMRHKVRPGLFSLRGLKRLLR